MIGLTRLLGGTLVWALAAQTAAPSLPVIPSAELSRRVRHAIRLDYQLQKEFTYVERRQDVRISKLGKVTIGPPRTFEVLPDPVPGQTYKRLIAINGVPLGADELARREAEHQKDLAEARERIRRETPPERAARLEKAGSEQRRSDQILDDAFRVYEARIEGRQIVDGQPVLVTRMTPRRDVDVSTREGRWMKQFEGQLWVAEADYQIVRVDMRAVTDVTIGWGVIGRIHKGSRLVYQRRHFENVWLPSETTYEARGRTMIFRPFEVNVTTTYSGYKRRDKSMND